MSESEYRLPEASLEFARKHIERFYASDFFPDAPEFDAIWASWDQVMAVLTQRNVSEMGDAPVIVAAPKGRTGYRLVHQLQPLDAIAYTALAHVVAEDVETRRSPRSDETVYSYRIAVADDGRFFDEEHDGYRAYHARAMELSMWHSYVLSVDIASFYNHIYIHRLQGALEQCGLGLRSISKTVEEFLLHLNQRQSIGIPVGPSASIVFAEALLVDVDDFLRRHFPHVAYVRYVDDFRFFAGSALELEDVHHELTSYLYRAHRLTLASGKTSLLQTHEFRDQMLAPPEDTEQSAFRTRVEELFGDLSSFYDEGTVRDEPSWDTATPEERNEVVRELLHQLTDAANLNVGLARHLLRRCRRSRMRGILPDVLQEAEALLPVFRDVGLYLEGVLSSAAIVRHLTPFENMVERGAGRTPFARLWLRWLFSRRSDFARSSIIESYVTGNPHDVRAQALYARVNNRESWVRRRKDDWRTLGPWDRWALLLSSEILPSHERGVWMDAVIRKPPDPIDEFVAKFARSK